MHADKTSAIPTSTMRGTGLREVVYRLISVLVGTVLPLIALETALGLAGSSGDWVAVEGESGEGQ